MTDITEIQDEQCDKSPPFSIPACHNQIRRIRAKNKRLREALKNLSFAAQTSSGTAGADNDLIEAIDNAGQVLKGGA